MIACIQVTPRIGLLEIGNFPRITRGLSKENTEKARGNVADVETEAHLPASNSPFHVNRRNGKDSSTHFEMYATNHVFASKTCRETRCT